MDRPLYEQVEQLVALQQEQLLPLSVELELEEPLP